MRILLFITLTLFPFYSKAQERFLIEENDSIRLFETYLSKNSKANVFPYLYNKGLIYLSNNKTKYHHLYYSNLQSESKKIITGSKFRFGSVSIFNNEIYFTGISKKTDKRGYYNLTIYKGIFENFKISKVKKLPFCDNNFSYSDPFISSDGKQLVLISNERKLVHIIEFVRNKSNQWVKKSVVFISHPIFDIFNPTFFDKDTIYFSSNILDVKINKIDYITNDKGEVVVDKVYREEGDFNIYKIKRINGIWGIPKKANKFNSEFDELGVLFDSKKSGYLTSFRFNSTDNIYYFETK
ncbi:DPP IV N-terminal domain-containing protein [Lutibacter sp.]